MSERKNYLIYNGTEFTHFLSLSSDWRTINLKKVGSSDIVHSAVIESNKVGLSLDNNSITFGPPKSEPSGGFQTIIRLKVNIAEALPKLQITDDFESLAFIGISDDRIARTIIHPNHGTEVINFEFITYFGKEYIEISF